MDQLACFICEVTSGKVNEIKEYMAKAHNIKSRRKTLPRLYVVPFATIQPGKLMILINT